GFGASIHVESVGAGKLLNADAHCLVALVFESAAVVFRAKLRVADVFEQHQAAGRVLDDDFVEFLGAGESAHHAHRNLKFLIGVGRRLPELASGNFDVLLLKRADDVRCSKPAGGHTDRVEPEAHGVAALAENADVPYSGHPLDGVHDVNSQVV